MLEAALKRVRVARHPWLVACDANMSPVEFDKKTSGFGGTGRMWCPERSFDMQVERSATKVFRKKKNCDYVIACDSLKGKSQMKEQAVRIESIHQEEFSLQSTATWEQWSEKEKEQWHQSQAMRAGLPGHG